MEAVADYIARDNPVRAISFVRELRAKCLGLAEKPLAFPLVPRYERYAIRRRVHGGYLIFYRAEAGRITLVHVLHGARDYAAVLSPEWICRPLDAFRRARARRRTEQATFSDGNTYARREYRALSRMALDLRATSTRLGVHNRETYPY